MNKPVAPALLVPDHLRERQVRASDPAFSIWVSANAGSGKTHVLTQRVIRLLLAGTAPSRILCLTFTKAAAAQMATRVFRTLSDWTMMEDRDLRDAIVLTGAPAPKPGDLIAARRLFTRTVETPGGLKIQTIHAFCERLLHLFPFEANVPARFAVADELRTGELMAAAKRGVIEDAQRAGPLGAALALVADLAGAFGVDRLIAEAMALRGDAQEGTGQESARSAALLARLGGGRYPDAESVRRAMVREGLGPARWPDLAERLAAGSKTDRDQAARLGRAAEALAAGAGTAAVLELYAPVFFKADGGERGSLVTAGTAKASAGLKEELTAEQQRLVALRNELKIAETAERTLALLQLVDAVAARYARAKAAGGLLDFDDLVERTLQLLRRSDAGWVLHKLDSGIDHVLVDEAQDTSRAQWQILERLTADFAAGAGARRDDRSFFVVGDDKQSIFSFQGAAPLMFERMRADFETRFRAGGKPFERVRLQTSFRSTAGILAAVDGVFAPVPHQDGLVQPGDVWPGHESIKAGLPALVEVWPRVKAEPREVDPEWRIPVDALAEDDPASELADRVARKVAALCAPLSSDRVHEGRSRRQRPVRPGDILILVRTRNAFFEAVIRALKKHRVAVAGADRLDVANHIAVMDLVAAGRAALLPDDDLSLACVLKSPLFGLDDDDLLVLAPARKGPLLAALGASVVPRHRKAHATLARWRARASATPFAFYVELLGRDGGRRLMEARLGPEAHDAIDEFLRLALVHEREGAPSLSTFLAQVEALETSIKRDMENAADAVRVMTVHAAKGLEAKIVFLPDTCSVPAPSLDPVVFDLAADEEGAAPMLAWSPRKGDDPPAVARARDARRLATMREYRRLLYVAMTRAEERLYLSGFFRAKAPPDECWDAMIRVAFEAGAPEGAVVEHVPAFWDEAETVLRVSTPGASEPAMPSRTDADQALFDLAPPWLAAPAPEEAAPAPRMRPSRLGAGGDAAAERREGALFGTLVHELLQHLPGVEASRREAAGCAFLVSRAVPEGRRERALGAALGVLAHPDLAVLFAPGSRAEVAVSGRLALASGGERVVEGTVDRIAVAADGVVVADFKTGAVPAEAPVRYVEQLALYRRLLQPLWPDRPVRALLIWTNGPTPMWLDPVALDAAADAALGAVAGPA